MNPLEKAIKSGVKANAEIGRMFAKMGTGTHSRGLVPTVYRAGKRDLAQALKDKASQQVTRDIMSRMRAGLASGFSDLGRGAIDFGDAEARRQLGFYGIQPVSPLGLSRQHQSATEAIISRFDAQAAAVNGLISTHADPAMIVGDEERAGVLRSGDILAAGAFWLAELVWLSWSQTVFSSAPDADFQKQVVAALDNRTTDCCLRAHGQIQPLREKFDLTGTPRYADRVEWVPFHSYCRSAVVLYLAMFDDGLTARMQTGARNILNERASGRYIDRNPADAYG